MSDAVASVAMVPCELLVIMAVDQALAGCRILLVEDECFIGLEMDAILTEAGAEIVGPVRDVESAMAEARRDGFELAVLDVRINGGLTFDIADELIRNGVRLVFTTGYDLSVIPGRFTGVRCWMKPINQDKLVEGLVKLYREALTGSPDTLFACPPEPRAH